MTISVRQFTLENPPELEAGVKLGGFSGVVPAEGDPPDVFHTIIDRGPNGLIHIGGANHRTFPLADLGPSIYKIRFAGDRIEVLERIPILRPNGTPISPLPNLPGADETPFDVTGQKQLAFDPEGLDTEGIAYDATRDVFWACDEYMSLVQISRKGTIMNRLVPAGNAAKLGLPYAHDVFPEYLTKRPRNRGFEGVSVSPSGRFLFGVVQNPLQNPNAAVGDTSRVVRIVRVDLATLEQSGEYVYLTEDASTFQGVHQADVSLSDIYASSDTKLLVVERDKNAGPNARIKRIYSIDVSAATNVKGVSEREGVTLEAMNPTQLRQAGVEPVAKKLLVDVLATIPGYPYEKIEGLAAVGPRRLIICADNDFGVEYQGAEQVQTGQPTQCHELTFSRDSF
ncbi:esterase-like activity of phytase family protein [Pendulispora brunnea]|uniref:Esterase-like activity of phytase family protein n=1 Tax=Pendulispora brunnea TaxID=2905690 RepID=A0ABZ2JTW4_9BACT